MFVFPSIFSGCGFWPVRRLRSRRGAFYLLGMIIVLLIILVLVAEGYLGRDKETGKAQAEAYIARAKTTACLADRQAMYTDMQRIKMQGQVSPHVLRIKFGDRRCPEGGSFQVDEQGNIYCTLHEPAPEGLSVTTLESGRPVAGTPPPLPAAGPAEPTEPAAIDPVLPNLSPDTH